MPRAKGRVLHGKYLFAGTLTSNFCPLAETPGGSICFLTRLRNLPIRRKAGAATSRPRRQGRIGLACTLLLVSREPNARCTNHAVAAIARDRDARHDSFVR